MSTWGDLIVMIIFILLAYAIGFTDGRDSVQRSTQEADKA